MVLSLVVVAASFALIVIAMRALRVPWFYLVGAAIIILVVLFLNLRRS
ncbi:MAG TPA: hypothetical protein VD966_10185 [Pyrinomonadaceae bacterium]|nr:hypothetical protein [Pyrinomonadaceae bacterium]